LNNFVYIIIINVAQTMEKKDNKVIEKVDDLYNDLNTKKQPKDLRSNLGIVEGNTRSILDPNFNIDHLKKFSIVLKLFNLRIKIFKNVFYIIIKNSIYIYLKDL